MLWWSEATSIRPTGRSRFAFLRMASIKPGNWRKILAELTERLCVDPRSSDVKELMNLQDVEGVAKPYQVRQFLKLVERYNLIIRGES